MNHFSKQLFSIHKNSLLLTFSLFFLSFTRNAFAEKYKWSEESINSDFKKIDMFVGVGVAPFKLSFGMGYFINPNLEGTLEYNSMFWPLSLNITVLSVGFKHFEENSNITYSFETGPIFPNNEGSILTGIFFEGDLGYFYRINSGFYISCNLSISYLLRENKGPYMIPGINMAMGLYF